MPVAICPKCDKTTGGKDKSVCCHLCEQWIHTKCVEGMNNDYLENIEKLHELMGMSGFLCKTCKKVASKIGKDMKRMDEKIVDLENRVVILELERDNLVAKVETLEAKGEKTDAEMKGWTTVVSKAKKEVISEVKNELKEKEERSENIVVYGLAESKDKDIKKRVEHDEKLVKDMIKVTEVQVKGGVEVKFRAGKVREDGKARPLIVTIKDEDSRKKIMENARKLGRDDDWKQVFVAPDLTYEQRESEKKKEQELKDQAEKQSEETKAKGKKGKFKVVGRRGWRRIVWEEEKDQE